MLSILEAANTPTASVNVCIGDLDSHGGSALAAEFSNVKFVRCDVTSWTDQVALFREAAGMAEHGRVHYVIANAGIAPRDDVFQYGEYRIGAKCRGKWRAKMMVV